MENKIRRILKDIATIRTSAGTISYRAETDDFIVISERIMNCCDSLTSNVDKLHDEISAHGILDNLIISLENLKRMDILDVFIVNNKESINKIRKLLKI